jgi:hypothetical protein
MPVFVQGEGFIYTDALAGTSNEGPELLSVYLFGEAVGPPYIFMLVDIVDGLLRLFLNT